MTLKYDSFLNGINLTLKMYICIIALLVKASWMQCPLHNQKVNKPVSMVPRANWHHPTSGHTKYSTYQQHCIDSKCSLWEWRWQPQQNLPNSVLSPTCLLVSLNADVLVVVVVLGCLQGSWSQVATFSCCSHCLPLAQWYQNNFQEPVL